MIQDTKIDFDINFVKLRESGLIYCLQRAIMKYTGI